MLNSKATFTMSTWGNEVSITLPNSDLGVDQVFDAFKGLFLASGWSEKTWKDHVRQLALEYEEEDIENL